MECNRNFPVDETNLNKRASNYADTKKFVESYEEAETLTAKEALIYKAFEALKARENTIIDQDGIWIELMAVKSRNPEVKQKIQQQIASLKDALKPPNAPNSGLHLYARDQVYRLWDALGRQLANHDDVVASVAGIVKSQRK